MLGPRAPAMDVASETFTAMYLPRNRLACTPPLGHRRVLPVQHFRLDPWSLMQYQESLTETWQQKYPPGPTAPPVVDLPRLPQRYSYFETPAVAECSVDYPKWSISDPAAAWDRGAPGGLGWPSTSARANGLPEHAVNALRATRSEVKLPQVKMTPQQRPLNKSRSAGRPLQAAADVTLRAQQSNRVRPKGSALRPSVR
eukprot:gnl/TRDRNA2_/TRDRNA2_90253_c0_seq1.p1 gnl/TRDRNA2_/TRDRNA2_90253_c0~~gnl/TRDRNA2_/TRDRNA2_90253_c0_seq1.p1  ORF type:complete len:199 (+),score=15.06 gnl/TRDRNA2_/TRDRNA2_90253_c0_seq1:66-662(+)